MVGQHDAARAHADARSRSRQVPHQHRCGRAGDARHIVVLGHPVAAKAQTLGVLHRLARHIQRLAYAGAFAHRDQIQHREFESGRGGHVCFM